MPVGYRLNRKDKDIDKIREEEVPLIDSGGAHHNEGVHDIEVVVSNLRPEGAMQRIWRKSMVGRKQEESHQQARDSDGATNLHHALGLVVVGGKQLVVKKAVKNVVYKNLELALLTFDSAVFGLDCQ
jgi:hypothetical protein